MNPRLPTPPFLIAHRGDSRNCPENTEAAVRSALVAAAQAVECDVQLSRDGEAIVFHDEDLVRLAGSSQRVEELDAAALVGLEVRVSGRHGTPNTVLSLARWCELLPSNVLPVVELKPQRCADREALLVDAVLAVLGERALHAALISFSSFVTGLLRERAIRLPFGPISSRPLDEESAWSLVGRGSGCVVVKKTLLEDSLVRAVRDSGQQLWVYALDEEVEIRRALELGVSGVISNAPTVARRVLDDFGASGDRLRSGSRRTD